MFGFLYIAFQGICGFIGGIKNIIDDENTKQRTFDSNDDIYMDRLGRWHDNKTGYSVNITHNSSGDTIIKNYEHKFERNIDQEKRDVEYNKLKNKKLDDTTVSLYHRNYEDRSAILHDALQKRIAGGSYYKDLCNNEILVKRFFTMGEGGKVIKIGDRSIKSIGSMTFFMNYKSGKIVRVADGEYIEKRNDLIKKKVDGKYNGDINEDIKKMKNNIEKWIKEFNQNQEDKLNKFVLKELYMSNVEKEMFFDNYFYNNCSRR